jgi:hypothetical protein
MIETKEAQPEPRTADRGDVDYPARVSIEADTEDRNRLTAAFRFFLSIPHILLVGAPAFIVTSIEWTAESGLHLEWGSSGLLGAVACAAAVIAWFAILFTRRHPGGLWRLSAFYLRWRLRAIAYLALLRDEYPPFGEGEYAARLEVTEPEAPRDRVTVAFRLFLAIPHFLVLWLLNIAWAFTTALAWAAIILTGRYPRTLYGYAIGVLAWTVRLEAYMLLLTDEYPPFTLRA